MPRPTEDNRRLKVKLLPPGQIGDVMRESAQAAVHIHVPAGVTPKDAPSAGVAMFIALASLLTNRTVRSDTAMTGEVSLRGLVRLP